MMRIAEFARAAKGAMERPALCRPSRQAQRMTGPGPGSTFASGAAGQPRVEIGLIGKEARKLKRVLDPTCANACPVHWAGGNHRDLFSQGMSHPSTLTMPWS
jgi:hypothetical protein